MFDYSDADDYDYSDEFKDLALQQEYEDDMHREEEAELLRERAENLRDMMREDGEVV